MEIEEKLNTPLVSIVVVTYNSSKYVLETLESAKAQTYQNIELIVTDDCSSDNTVAVCEKWIKENKERFVRTELITVTKNTGIAPNCNRGAKTAAGEWVKVIAGDDVLEFNILEKYLWYIYNNNNVNILYSNVREYQDEFLDKNLLPLKELKNLPFNLPEATSQEQFEILLRSNNVWASTIMTKRTVLEAVGWYDEKYPFFEDRPILLAILKIGHKIHYIDIMGAKYRRHNESVQIKTDVFLSKFREDNLKYFYYECLSYYTLIEQNKLKRNFKKNMFLKDKFKNKKSLLVKILNRII